MKITVVDEYCGYRKSEKNRGTGERDHSVRWIRYASRRLGVEVLVSDKGKNDSKM